MELTSRRWHEVRGIYESALVLEGPERAAFLERSCAADPALRAEVDSLLQASERAGNFLEQPVGGLATLAAQLPQASRAGQLIGSYRLDAMIGQGGMGEVYRARRADGEFDRQVAIKLVRGGFDTAAIVKRFGQEKQILAALQHPHIAQLLDAGATDDGIPYLVIEYLAGTPIDRFCTARAADLRTRLGIFLEVCDAVQFAHQRLVVHRDLKPANILVTEGGEVKLLDFGIAKLLDGTDRVEVTQTMMLTPAYASPEQIRGEAITTSSDVFSLGVLLYKLLTGSSPYSKDTADARSMAMEICERDPPGFAAVLAGSSEAPVSSLPRELEQITLKALRKLPADRYASVEEMARDLRNFLDGRPVLAARGSTLYRIRKFATRHRVAVGAGAAALLLAVAGIVEIVQQRRIAERRFDDVHQLANTVIFDVHDAIADLPGSTPARKVIVQRALEYLARLEGEGATSIELQRDMASAYEKIANVQGAPNSPNVGEPDGADRNYRKALALREAIVARTNASVTDQVELARSRRILADFLLLARGDAAGAELLARKALEIGERLAREHPDDAQVRAELADDQQYLGGVLAGSAQGSRLKLDEAAALYSAAERNVMRLAQAAPGDLKMRQRAVISAVSGANLQRQVGDRAAALASLARSRAILVDMAKQSDSVKIRNNIAVVDSTTGEVQLENGNPSAALQSFNAAHERRLEALGADPQNVTLRTNEIANRASLAVATAMLGRSRESAADMVRAADDFHSIVQQVSSSDYRQRGAVIDVWTGYVLENAGDYLQAERFLQRAMAAYEAALASDASDLDAKIARCMTLVRRARVAIGRTDAPAAMKLLREAIGSAEALAGAQRVRADIDLARAEAYAAAGDASALAHEAGQARQWYEKSAEIWRRQVNPGAFSGGGFPLGSLAAVEAKLR